MLYRLSDGRTRFDVAQEAAAKVIREFQDGVDSISVIPFGSQRVKERILGAKYVDTRQDALRLLNALPRPEPRNNTGLYSAAFEALRMIELRKEQDPSRRFQLVLLTDGRNDVNNPSDDAGLLDGEEGLNQVIAERERVGIEIFAVGFGKRGEVDEGALKRVASQPENYIWARETVHLEQILREIRKALINRVRITFFTDETDWRRLQTLTFRVRFQPSPSRWIESPPLQWVCPVLTGCSPEGSLTETENRARLEAETGPAADAGVWRRLAIVGGFSAFLSLFWFGLPRLIWPSGKGFQALKGDGTGPKTSREKQTPRSARDAHDDGSKSVGPMEQLKRRKGLDKTAAYKSRLK
jgi:hypothetical protein